MSERFHGPVPDVGRRVRHYHPWIDDYAVGTVSRIEVVLPESRFGSFDEEVTGAERPYLRCRVHLTDCEHWGSDHEWGSAPDTYFDNLAESWEYAEPAGAQERAVETQGSDTVR